MIPTLSVVLESLNSIKEGIRQRSAGLDSHGYISDDLEPFTANEDYLADRILQLSDIVKSIAVKALEK